MELRHSPTQIAKINILKGIAILGVFLYHSQLSLFPGSEVKAYNQNNVLDISGVKSFILNFSPVAYGWSGVLLFLLISGFLIHFGFLAAGKKLEILPFYKKRFWRIYPPYLLVLLFFCFTKGQTFYYLFSVAGIKDFLLHLTLSHNLTDRTYYSINASFWSLALEAQLYLLYPVLLYARAKWGMGKTLIGLVVLSTVVLLAGAVVGFFGSKSAFPSNVFICWFIWAAGAYLAEKLSTGEKIFKRNVEWVIIAAFAVAIFSRYSLYSTILMGYLLPVGWLAFFEWFLYKENINISARLPKAFAVIGLCSYSIYLIHQPYLGSMLAFFDPLPLGPSIFKLLKLIPVALIIFLVSYTMYLWIELKSVSFGKTFQKKLSNSTLFNKKNKKTTIL